MTPPCPALPARAASRNSGGRHAAQGARSSALHRTAESTAPASRDSADEARYWVPPSFDEWWERYQLDNNITETRSETRGMERATGAAHDSLATTKELTDRPKSHRAVRGSRRKLRRRGARSLEPTRHETS